jgi:hypothetical protein
LPSAPPDYGDHDGFGALSFWIAANVFGPILPVSSPMFSTFWDLPSAANVGLSGWLVGVW